jgi:hypothetical protein
MPRVLIGSRPLTQEPFTNLADNLTVYILAGVAIARIERDGTIGTRCTCQEFLALNTNRPVLFVTIAALVVIVDAAIITAQFSDIGSLFNSAADYLVDIRDQIVSQKPL